MRTRLSGLGGILLSCLALVACDGPSVSDAGFDAGGELGLDAGSSDAGRDTGATSPGRFVLDLETSAGPIAIEVNEAWAPLGAARVRELVESGYYDDSRFFRVVPGFVAQFGLAGDPSVTSMWSSNRIVDDPVVESNLRGTVTFATAGPNTRTTQLFINYADNSFLDAMGFAPFGRVIEGMENADAINAEYGQTPMQSRISSEGNAYLDASFPNLTRLTRASIR